MEIGDPCVANVQEGGEPVAEAVACVQCFGGDNNAGGVDVGAG